jgi:hypothetical protein
MIDDSTYILLDETAKPEIWCALTTCCLMPTPGLKARKSGAARPRLLRRAMIQIHSLRMIRGYRRMPEK